MSPAQSKGFGISLKTDETFSGRLSGKPPQTFTSPPPSPPNPAQVGEIANALRELEQLRQEGLISEYEFEQKRRSLLDQV